MAASALDVNAIPFITIDSTPDGERFNLNPEALDYLRSLRGRVAVVSVVGMYRTGKSYLLNMLMGKNGGFQVGPTVRSCTKGIWLWGKAMPPKAFEGPTAPEQDDRAPTPEPAAATGAGGSAPPGYDAAEEPLNVLFMDTEGLGSIDRHASNTYDTRIFALALLLSSFFIYNSVGTIDGAAISRLNLVVNLTQHIRVRAQGDADRTGRQFAEFFPNFLWVVRDFSVELRQAGRRIQAKDYLEKALEPEDGISEEVSQKNDIRKAIRNFFPTRDCVTMVRPITDENALAHLVEQPWDSLRPEFRRQVEILRKKVFENVRPNSMSGQPLTGPMLARLAEAYVDDLNRQGTPTISTAWDRVVDSQCADAVEHALRLYRDRMQQAMEVSPPLPSPDGAEGKGPRKGAGVAQAVEVPEELREPRPGVWEDAQLLEEHGAQMLEAHRLFMQQAVRDWDKITPFQEELFRKAREQLALLRVENERRSESSSVRLLQHLFAALSERLRERSTATAARSPSPVVDASPREEGGEEDGDVALQSFPEATTEYRRLLERTRALYELYARGPASGRVLARFFSAEALDTLDAVAGNVQSALRERVRQLQRALDGMTEKATQAEEAAREKDRAWKDDRRQWESEMRQTVRENEMQQEALRARLSDLQDQFSRDHSAFEQARAAFSSALEELRGERQERGRRVAQLEEEARRLREAVDASSEKRAESAEQVAELERALRELEVAEQESRAERDVMTERVRGAENELVRLREQTELLYSSLRTEKEAVEAKKEELEELTYQMGTHNARMAELQSEKSELDAELASLREVAEQMKRVLEERRLVRSLDLDRVGWATLHSLGAGK